MEVPPNPQDRIFFPASSYTMPYQGLECMPVEKVEAGLSNSSLNKFCSEGWRTEDGKRVIVGSRNSYIFFFTDKDNFS